MLEFAFEYFPTCEIFTHLRISRRVSWLLFLPLCIVFAIFCAIPGPQILNPQSIGWLANGDPGQHFLGWHFFRKTPWAQSPMGANPKYGLELGSSIVYTDSIPAAALFFKLIRGILPPVFQYQGLWFLLSFLLQGLFAWKLMERLTASLWIRAVCTSFFVIAPPFLLRLHGHEALTSHWMILAGPLLYFSDRFYPGRWCLLIVLASWIHAYMWLMVSILWLADVASRVTRKKVTARDAALWGAATACAMAVAMWQAGYFMLPADTLDGGFGLYRMNLFALVHGNGGWSQIFDAPWNRDTAQDEGFSFLGLGMTVLVVLAAGEILRGAFRVE